MVFFRVEVRRTGGGEGVKKRVNGKMGGGRVLKFG